MAFADGERSPTALVRRLSFLQILDRGRRSGVAAGGSTSPRLQVVRGGSRGETENLCGAVDNLGRASLASRRRAFPCAAQRGTRARKEEHRREAGPIGDEEVKSSRTPSSSCSGSQIEESKPEQCDPERDRSQELARARANRGRGTTGSVPELRGSELPGRGWDPAPGSRAPPSASARPPWSRRGACGGRGRRAEVPLRVLWRRALGRPSGCAAATAVQRGGDRPCPRALGPRACDGGHGAASGQPGGGARLRGDGGLGDLAALGEGREESASLRDGARRWRLGHATGGGCARSDGARGERGFHDAASVA